MSLHCFESKQHLPITIEHAWEFFSDPKNLSKITPPEMNFKILTVLHRKETYAGQIIQYDVSPLPWMRTRWVTEITHVEKPLFFVDEQRIGPYSIWHHQHHFESVSDGVLMTDIVHYSIPLGPLGDAMNELFIRKRIKAIFDYRTTVLNRLFPSKKQE
jgi:ligand-binding SRPBCC domain-containing protein